MRFNKLHVHFVKLYLFFIPVLHILFFLLNDMKDVSENVHLVKCLHFSSVLLPHLRNRIRTVGYDLGRSIPCLEAFKVVELVSLKLSVHLQLNK